MIGMGAVSARPDGRPEGEGTAAAVATLVKWLRLAATPAFAIMALLSGLMPGPMDYLCSAGTAAPVTGMAAMYLLMSVFHLPPWLTLIALRRGPAARL